MEVYGVPQEPPSDPVVRALDVRALGLALTLASLVPLPSTLSSVVQMLVLGGFGWDGEAAAMFIGLLVANVLQVVAGLAIAWQWPTRLAVFVAMTLASLALVAIAWRLMAGELGLRPTLAALIELLGTPLLVVLAPWWFDLRRLTAANAVGGVLIGYAVSAWISTPISLFDQMRSFAEFQHADAGAWLSIGLQAAVALGVATCGAIAGIKMALRQPARGALRIYVIVAIAAPAVLGVGGLVYSLIVEPVDNHRMWSIIVSTTLISLGVGVIRPLVLWFYAKQEQEGLPVDGALPWIALWFVPHLLSRCLLWEELMAYAGDRLGFVLIAICLALGIVMMLAARDALRDPRVMGPWVVASFFAAALMVIALYITHAKDNRFQLDASAVLAPTTLLFATTATAAWLRRRVTSEG